MKTTTGRSASAGIVADALQHLEAGHVGQAQIEHDAIAAAARAAIASASAPVPAVTISMSSWPSSSRDAQLLGGIVLDHQQPLAPRLRVFLDPRRAPRRGPRVVVGLVTKENAPRARPCWRSSSRVTICTGMCRVSGFCLSWLSTVQPSMSGRNTSSETARRLVLAWQGERIGAAHGDQHLEALVAGEIDQDAGVVRIVLDDQQDGVAGLDVEPVVGNLLDRRARRRGRPALGRRRRPRPPHGARRRRRADIFDRQVEREGAAGARRAAQLDFAAEQARQLAADGEAEAGAAVFAAGAGVGLLERLEDDLLLFRRNADAGIATPRRRPPPAPGCSTGCSALQPPRGRDDVEPHAALLGEFEGVRQQVLEHLLQALGVGDDAAAEIGIDVRRRTRAARFSASWRNGRATMSSRLAKNISSASTVTVPDSILERSRMSLMRLSRSVPAPWMVRANSTCLAVRLPSGLSVELLAEDQDAS